ncbi:tyrosine-protein phosphatase [Phenylobacterium soli]|uniref:Protein-tyrosine-phosphatase n=1 Tax=Phenylobacterium soli TaxID=2170551 RepID=A0A328AIQ0_9CAUL|nr:tyrosine-protein phosphatase [Phenylobacterium soli]RAK53946.1 protein-tyrosine-phosphatase [Phenylobacterium soli]
MTRRIPFEGIENFRDFGGYDTACGRGLRRGLLYRSGHHGAATDADLQKLTELGLSVVVDLRRPNERERFPHRAWPTGPEPVVITSDAEQEHSQEWLDFIQESDLSAASFRDYMTNYYRTAPLDPRYVDLYRRYFEALASTDGAILVHCAAGKDRTGVICALTHHIAGVADEDIRADYLATNDPVRAAARADMIKGFIHETTGRMPEDGVIRYIVGVEPEFLDEAFAAIRRAHGSLDGYLEEAIGLTADQREQIRGRLLG